MHVTHWCNGRGFCDPMLAIRLSTLCLLGWSLMWVNSCLAAVGASSEETSRRDLSSVYGISLSTFTHISIGRQPDAGRGGVEAMLAMLWSVLPEYSLGSKSQEHRRSCKSPREVEEMESQTRVQCGFRRDIAGARVTDCLCLHA